ncbi:GAF domain-containing protein [Streptomyces sp. NPDC005953]|uniref:GAF domain-containing protein n=1 Tax=Streptomyces sp. NPDC005953 TaxID=3156719 RepID=UPI00340D2511
MSFDPTTGYHTLRTLHDNTPRRLALLNELGLTGLITQELDAFAETLAREADEPFAMVNLIGDSQHFAGLYAATHTPDGEPLPPVGRTMSLEHGYCPDVIDRNVALILPDVCASPRFASNDVVDSIGIRTYAGAPIIHPTTGLPIGTVCVVGTQARPKTHGKPRLHLIKNAATKVAQLL